MGVKRKDKTTLLPQALLEQISSQEASYTGGYSRKRGQSRRERRELEWVMKKRRKIDFYSSRRVEEERPKKRVKFSQTASSEEWNGISNLKKNPVSNDLLSQGVKDKPIAKVQKGKEKAIIPVLGSSRSQVEINEDREIAWLEHQLGLAGPKSKGGKGKERKMWEEEGLEDLLDGLEESFTGTMRDGAINEEEDEEFDEESDGESAEDQEEEEWKGIAQEDVEMEEDASDSTSDSEESDESMGVADATLESPSTSKYIPPHLRKASTQNDAKNALLLKQSKGQLNRLSEANISTILSELEKLYRDNARNDVTSTLVKVMIEGIGNNASLLDGHIALNAALVAALFRVVGIEFAAYFVQELVKAYDTAYNSASQTTGDASIIGKESLNLIVCIAELYNFEVISCVLIYDIIRSLLKEDMGELEVELLLKILKICGRQLRQDDPLALKDIVQIVSDQTTHRKDALSSRTRFMIETLSNLKNNRVKKADAGGSDTVEKMKKFISGLKRGQSGREPLRVTLQDLINAEEKGKWWLVGNAWAGDPLVDHKRAKESMPIEKEQESQKLSELARKQGMNTDVRRSIFVVLMNSEDYFDACEKLNQLNLTEQQQREVIRVLLHCCGNERTYNPYYALVGQRLCEQQHSYKITAQFCLWDFLRDLGEGEVGGTEMLKTRAPEFDGGKSVSKERARNIARMYGWWLAKGAVSLSILKPLDFLKLKSQTRDFLDTMFSDMFIASQVQAPVLSKTGLASLWNQGKHEKQTIEEIVIKAVRQATLARGLIVFYSSMERRLLPKLEGGEKLFMAWALEIGKDALDTGLSLVPQID